MRSMMTLIMLILLLLTMPTHAQQATPDEFSTLQVSEVLPADGAEAVTTDAVITIVFNRPVVPLLIVEEMDSLPQPLTFDPLTTGEGEWINTFVYTYTPAEALIPGTPYTVTVNPITAVDGSTMEAPYQWSFVTNPASIVRIQFNDGTEYRLDPTINVYFNTSVNRQAVEKYFSLRSVIDPMIGAASDVTTRLNAGLNIETGDAIPGTFEWDDLSAIAFFTPDERLENETVYLAEVDIAGVTAEYGIQYAGESKWAFQTMPYPEVVEFTPPDNGETEEYSGFSILFNTFMDADSINERLTIDPQPENYQGYRSSMRYQGVFNAMASTTYTIRIEPGIEDVYGNVYDRPIEFTYTTVPFSPQFDLRIPFGPVAFYNAYEDETGLFIRHRNVNEVRVQLHSLPVDQFIPLMQTTDREKPNIYTYTPSSTENLLREWSVDLPNVQNASMPTLLLLGPRSACGGSLQTSLRLGDIVSVQTESEVKVLSFPVDGAQRFTVFDGIELPIIGGPFCANEQVWWQVEIGTTSGWLPESLDDATLLEYVDSTQESEIAVSDGDALKPGIYYLRVSMNDPMPEQTYFRSHVMMVMTANLTLKHSRESLTVWATDVQSGAPIPNTPITIYNENGVIAAGLTDETGLLTMHLPPTDDLTYNSLMAVMSTESQFGLGATRWADGIDPGMFGESAAFRYEPYTAALYTDRKAYRPGETLYYRGIVRARQDMSYTVPDDLHSVIVTLSDGENDIEQEVTLTPYGTFSGEVILSENAILSGNYSIYITYPAGDELRILTNALFSIAEFRLPEFQVNITPAAQNVAQGDTIQIDINGEYYSGGAVSNAVVDYQIISSPLYFQYVGKERYNFYQPFDGDMEYDHEIAEGRGTTNSDGALLLEIPADLGKVGISQRFSIEATVYDEANQPVSTQSFVNIHSGEWYIGSRAERYVNHVGNEATIHTLLVDWDSIGVPNEQIDVEVVRREWFNVQERDPNTGAVAWTWDYHDTPAAEGAVLTDDEGKAAFAFVPEEAGSYLVNFSTRDSLGNEIVHTAQVWVSGQQYVAWRMNNNNRITLVTDQDGYRVGDTAEILIASPFQEPAYALVTVERDGIISTEVILMESNSHVYRLNIEEDFAPNVFVSVMIVSGVNDSNPVTTFRMGMVRLLVNTEQKQLMVEIEADAERAEPKETVTYTVHVTDYAGNPVQAEVGVALTEAPALAITGGNLYDHNWLVGAFYHTQGVGVRTSTPLTINTDQLTQQILDQIKGGGGGGMQMAFDVRSNFISTSYFNGAIITDENGEASFEVTLPDNLTTWTLNAYAVTDASDGVTRLGFGTHDLISTRPLIVRPVTPRFMVVDDKVTLAALVNNNTGSTLSVEVSLQADGVTLFSDATQTVVIPADGRARVEWLAEVENVEDVELIFYSASEDGTFTDASRPPLGHGDDRLIPVYRYEVLETVGTSGILRDESTRTETIQLPQEMTVQAGELHIEVQPSLAGITADGLDYLENYPYQCVEQTVSRFLPNVMTYRALESLNLADAELRADLEDAVDFALDKLYAEQKVDGGWGWFVTENSDSLTTAYALIGLVEAQNQGFYIHHEVIANAANYLNNQLIRASISQTDWALNRQAFILYALAQAEMPNIAATANLFDYRDRLSLEARAFLTLTLHSIDPETTIRTDALLSDFNTLAIMSATGTHWEEAGYDRWNWGSSVRTNALILKVLVELQPESELIPNVVRWLMDQRINRAWLTTQETAWSVMALTDWMLVSGDLRPAYAYAVDFNGMTHLEETVTFRSIRDTNELVISVEDMLRDEANQLVISRSSGDGTLYYTAHMSLMLPVQEVEALDRGIIVQRQYFRRLENGEREPVTEAAVGELIEVRLTIIAPNALHYVNIDDPIPAGVEAINRRLATTQQFGTRQSFSRIDSTVAWGWWWFSNIELHDEKVVLSASYLPAGTYEYAYLIRPMIPGEYNVIPTTAFEFYYPEVHGRSNGSLFRVIP